MSRVMTAQLGKIRYVRLLPLSEETVLHVRLHAMQRLDSLMSLDGSSASSRLSMRLARACLLLWSRAAQLCGLDARALRAGLETLGKLDRAVRSGQDSAPSAWRSTLVAAFECICAYACLIARSVVEEAHAKVALEVGPVPTGLDPRTDAAIGELLAICQDDLAEELELDMAV